MGAGLGGGSADGAFTLVLLNDLFELNLTTAQLESYALKLGSDCPFFIKNQPAIASSRGEILAPTSIDLSGHFLAIHNPEIHVSTKEAYSGIIPGMSQKGIDELLQNPILQWQGQLINDFEKSIFNNYPEIAQLKQEMLDAGAIYSSMTGSGSTVYGIFEEKINEKWRWISL